MEAGRYRFGAEDRRASRLEAAASRDSAGESAAHGEPAFRYLVSEHPRRQGVKTILLESTPFESRCFAT